VWRDKRSCLGFVGGEMRKRVFLFFVLLCFLLLGGYLVLWLTVPRGRISKESFDRLDVGVTLEEVVHIIGVPPGNHGHGRILGNGFPELYLDPLAILKEHPLGLIPKCDYWLESDPPTRMREWWGDSYRIFILFDSEDRLIRKDSQDIFREATLLTKLRRRLGIR
jgi:hypothetical protein